MAAQEIKNDIYFEPSYGKLYEDAEHGKSMCWQYEGREGKVSHQFIVRKIPIVSENNGWFDIVTPYGYGGPVINYIADGCDRKILVSAFGTKFKKYCRENNIVSEFVRFHPVIENALDFQNMYHAECVRKTVGTNLKNFDNPVSAEFTKSCRKSIRQAIRKGVGWRVKPCPEQIDIFKEIYYSTMNRNHADDYYFFDDKYFQNCIKWFGQNLLLVEALFENQTIAAGLYFLYGRTIHIHLSGTLSEYLHLSPAYILRYAVTLWGKENGYELIHHGGGRSNDEDDNLYTFKKQFGKNTSFDFYVGRKIWNEEVYDKLCQIRRVGRDSAFFPAYREKDR